MADRFSKTRRRSALGMAFVFLILAGVLVGCGPGGVGAGEHGGRDLDGFMGRPGDVRNGLKPSEWYDSERDDYHRYTPEEVRKSMSEEKPRSNRDWSIRPPLLSAQFLRFIFWVFIGLLIAGAVYVLYLVIRNSRGGGNRLNGRLKQTENRVVHGKIIAGVDVEEEELSRAGLAAAIREALAAGDARRATVYVFLYALLLYSELEFLELAPQNTAREYVRMLRASGASDEAKQLLHEIAGAFEVAVYRQAVPDEDPADLWRRLEVQVS